MHLLKQNYLQIKYESKKGLLLNWNFKDLHQIHNYYHHLMVLVSPRAKINQSLLQQYYKRMKFGDLISFVYINTSQAPKQTNWFQKTQLATIQTPKIIDRITNDNLTPELIDSLFQAAARLTCDSSSKNVVTNFIFAEQEHERCDQYVKKIASFRQDGAFPYHCAFFNLQWFNKISFSSGIHFLNTEKSDTFQVLSVYHSIINSAAVRMARITIDCNNGQMMSYDAQVWHNSDFSRIQRTFYGPSVSYEEDLIQFHVLDAFDDTEFDMVITLNLQLFSGQMVSSTKRIKLSFQTERHYDKSLNLTTPEPLLTYQGVELKSNPFSTFTFVRLMRNSYQDFSEIKEKLEIACRTAKRTRERPTADRTTSKNQASEQQRRKPVQYFYPNKNTEQNQQFFI